MKDIIKLNSRDGTDNKLVKIADRSYKLQTPYGYRACYEGDKVKFIDPSGGPMIVVGEKLQEADAIVESIEKGVITFKE